MKLFNSFWFCAILSALITVVLGYIFLRFGPIVIIAIAFWITLTFLFGNLSSKN